MSKAFDKIRAGLEDALAFARGDGSRGRIVAPASVDRSAEGGETGSEADGLDPKDESAVDGAAGETPTPKILNRSNPNEPG